MNKDLEISEKEVEERMKFLTSVKCNHTQHMYIDITGDLIQGTLLSRIIYWFAEDKNKKQKVRIFKDGFFWIAKQRKDWWEEIRITERQYDKAIKELESKGFVVLAKYKFNSMPTIHIRPNYENINIATNKWQNQLREQIICEIKQELQESENGNDTKCNSQGNNTKCNTGITKDVNLLTMITNNDYESRDYSTENTDKYAFPDKSEKVDVNIYASFPEEKEAEMKKPSRYIPEDYTEEQLVEHIKPVIKKSIDFICDGQENKEELSSTLIEVVRIFYRKYYLAFGKRHRILSDMAYENIAERFMFPPDIMCDEDTQYDIKSYADMMDVYFTTEYNKQKKYSKEIELSISHFMSDEIRSNLFYRACYYEK